MTTKVAASRAKPKGKRKPAGRARTVSVKAKCNACGGTGLYSGFAEPRGTAVVCNRCGGTGCATITYTPFVKRRKRTDIKTVWNSNGACIVTGVGPTGGSITYKEFSEGAMPK